MEKLQALKNTRTLALFSHIETTQLLNSGCELLLLILLYRFSFSYSTIEISTSLLQFFFDSPTQHQCFRNSLSVLPMLTSSDSPNSIAQRPILELLTHFAGNCKDIEGKNAVDSV